MKIIATILSLLTFLTALGCLAIFLFTDHLRHPIKHWLRKTARRSNSRPAKKLAKLILHLI